MEVAAFAILARNASTAGNAPRDMKAALPKTNKNICLHYWHGGDSAAWAVAGGIAATRKHTTYQKCELALHRLLCKTNLHLPNFGRRCKFIKKQQPRTAQNRPQLFERQLHAKVFDPHMMIESCPGRIWKHLICRINCAAKVRWLHWLGKELKIFLIFAGSPGKRQHCCIDRISELWRTWTAAHDI